MNRPSRNTIIAGLLLLAWAGAMLAAYWWFEARYLRSFYDQTTLFNGEQLRLPDELTGSGDIRLVHFWDPNCPCNVGNQQHLTDLINRFSGRGVSFYSVRKAGTQGELPQGLKGMTALSELPGSAQIPASPAVAIWDQTGKLAYFGPYSEGAVCSSSNSFIEPILEALQAGRAVNASNNLAVGCFCNWPDD